MAPKKIKTSWIIGIFFCGAIASTTLNAQYFGSDAFQTPFVGWMGFDSSAGFLTGENQPWQTTDQLQVGFGYMHALVGYRLWYILQTAVGFGYAKNYEQSPNRVTIGLNVSSGLRYNFLEKRIRPFLMGQLEYLHLFNLHPFELDPIRDAGSSSAFWLGFLFGPGIEWIFAKDMGVQLEAGGHLLFDFLNPARFSWTARLSYVLYF